MTLLIDYARDVIGLPMRGMHHGRHVGWTTDRVKAERAREAGANISYYESNDPRFCGWEVSFAADREKMS